MYTHVQLLQLLLLKAPSAKKCFYCLWWSPSHLLTTRNVIIFCFERKYTPVFPRKYKPKHLSMKKPFQQRADVRSSLYSVALYEIISKWKPFTLSQIISTNISWVGLNEFPDTSGFVIIVAENRERERKGKFAILPPVVQRKKNLNKSMNSSPASGMYQKHQILAINECPLLQLEQKCHITENT